MDAVFAMLAVIAFIDIPTDHLTLNIHHIKPVAGEHIHDLPVLHRRCGRKGSSPHQDDAKQNERGPAFQLSDQRKQQLDLTGR